MQKNFPYYWLRTVAVKKKKNKKAKFVSHAYNNNRIESFNK